MSHGDPLGDYAALLTIRAKGYRRNSAILGLLFLVAFAASALLARGEERTRFLELVLVVFLGITWLATWVRHEIAKAQAEIAATLRDRAGV